MRGACRVWLPVIAACFFLHSAGAGDKDKKKAKPEPVLNKASELKAKDAEDKKTKHPSHTYIVTLTKDTLYQIDLKSTEFDAYLRLEDAKGKEVAFNDDMSASTRDARIVYKTGAAGDFKVIVTSFDGKLGKFTVYAIAIDKQPLQTGSRFRAKTPIALTLKDGKATHASELVEKDASSQSRYYKVFTVELEKDKAYRIDLKTKNPEKLDPLLYLEDADGAPLASNDDAGPGTVDSQITYKAARTGAYRIIATSLQASQVGDFKLDVSIATTVKK